MDQEKLGLEAAGWLWAINRNKADEYYKDNYGCGAIEFTNGIGGSIVNRFFRENDKLLSIAYRYLCSDWNLMLWTMYPAETFDVGKIKTKTELSFNEFSWMMFKSLAHSLKKTDIDELIEGDWKTLWSNLDAQFPDDEHVGLRRRLKNLQNNSTYGFTAEHEYIPNISAKYQIVCIPEVELYRVRVEKYLLSTGELVETTYEPLSDGYGGLHKYE